MNDEELDENQQEKQEKLGIENAKREKKKQDKKNQRKQTIKKIWQQIPLKVKLILIRFSGYICILNIFRFICNFAFRRGGTK